MKGIVIPILVLAFMVTIIGAYAQSMPNPATIKVTPSAVGNGATAVIVNEYTKESQTVILNSVGEAIVNWGGRSLPGDKITVTVRDKSVTKMIVYDKKGSVDPETLDFLIEFDYVPDPVIPDETECDDCICDACNSCCTECQTCPVCDVCVEPEPCKECQTCPDCSGIDITLLGVFAAIGIVIGACGAYFYMQQPKEKKK